MKVDLDVKPADFRPLGERRFVQNIRACSTTSVKSSATRLSQQSYVTSGRRRRNLDASEEYCLVAPSKFPAGLEGSAVTEYEDACRLGLGGAVCFTLWQRVRRQAVGAALTGIVRRFGTADLCLWVSYYLRER